MRDNWLLTTNCPHGEGLKYEHFEKFSDAVNAMQRHLDSGHDARLSEGLENHYGDFKELSLTAGLDVRFALEMREED